jgi:hypothetical protein
MTGNLNLILYLSDPFNILIIYFLILDRQRYTIAHGDNLFWYLCILFQ